VLSSIAAAKRRSKSGCHPTRIWSLRMWNEPRVTNAAVHRQQITLLIAMQVRNSLEDFHVSHLSNDQMKELNRTIRQGIFDALTILGEVDDPLTIRLGWDSSLPYSQTIGRDPTRHSLKKAPRMRAPRLEIHCALGPP
jgi:hypothetical protein